MSTITDATEMPRRIWIEPECCAGGDVTEQRWAEDDIFDCDEGARATEYVRADLVAEMLEALKVTLQHGRIDDSEARMNLVAAAIAKAEEKE